MSQIVRMGRTLPPDELTLRQFIPVQRTMGPVRKTPPVIDSQPNPVVTETHYV
ncbi:hypothetical protein SLA_4347 [Streptomyces laurentii]|uniref:Uncharacterized protein n=1 Tax=Streptomyces laurentii TaxID=39478 RepID=A0A160P385_STRLU|nr:hypothetical protein SLA_4347 [Streptomyces laurentii]